MQAENGIFVVERIMNHYQVRKLYTLICHKYIEKSLLWSRGKYASDFNYGGSVIKDKPAMI